MPYALCLCCLVSLAAAQEPGPWRILFDGRDLAAWRAYGQEALPAKGWTIADGALVSAKGGGGGDLITRARFEDFEFEFEWRVTKGANSGVMYWVQETQHPTWHTGPEFQVLDDAAHADADPRHLTGAIYGLAAPEGKVLKPAGEWNQGRIRVRQGRIEHAINGVSVVQDNADSLNWVGRVQASKFGAMDGFARHARGHIALQDHGDEVHYRNIRIREWPLRDIAVLDLSAIPLADAFRVFPAPTAESKSPWSTSEDGSVIACTGTPTGYILSAAEFGDGTLEFEWQWPGTPGNSGVLLGVTGADKIWPKGIEAQLKHGSAGDIFALGGFAVAQGYPRTEGIRTARLGDTEGPLQTWNHYRITVRGARMILEINGRVANEVVAAEKIRGRILFQSEGAPIRIRKIRVHAASE